jgi:hypothetical protein
MTGRSFHYSRERPSVTYVILIVIAALLLAGLWYVRGRRA